MKQVIKFGMLAAAGMGLAISAHAQDSFQNLSDATGDSAAAASRVTAAGGQVALGAIAIPLAIAGSGVESTGNAANITAGDLWEAANAPLVVDEDIALSAQPLPDVPHSPETRNSDQEE